MELLDWCGRIKTSLVSLSSGKCRSFQQPIIKFLPTAAPYRWCCQTNANQSQFTPMRQLSGRAELAPLGEGDGTVELEDVPTGEAAFLVEVVVDG